MSWLVKRVTLMISMEHKGAKPYFHAHIEEYELLTSLLSMWTNIVQMLYDACCVCILPPITFSGQRQLIVRFEGTGRCI